MKINQKLSIHQVTTRKLKKLMLLNTKGPRFITRLKFPKLYSEPCIERRYTQIQESALEAPGSYLIRRFNTRGSVELMPYKFYGDVSKRTLLFLFILNQI